MRHVAIVVAVAVLAGVAAGATTGTEKDRARAAATRNQMQTIATSIEAYLTDEETPPAV